MGKHALQDVEGFVRRRDYFYVDPRSLVIESGFNPRDSIGDKEDHELKKSIVANGVLEPLRVQKNKDNQLVIREGHRRHWACLEAIKDGYEIKEAPVILIDKSTSPGRALFLALNCNTGRNLSPLEEGNAFERLLRHGFQIKEVADNIGRSVGYVYERLKLVNITPEVRAALEEGRISIRDAANAAGRSGGDTEKQNQSLRLKPKVVRVQYSKRVGRFVTKNGTEDPALSALADFIIDDRLLDVLEDLDLDPATVRITVRPKKTPKDTNNQYQMELPFSGGTRPEDVPKVADDCL